MLLGSPRAETSALPVRAIQERGVRVVGAHIGTLKRFASERSAGLEDELTDDFFRLLADGLSFSDLIERRSPADAAALYEVAAQQPSLVAAAFDWSGERWSPTSICQNVFPWLASHRALRAYRYGDIGARNALALPEAEGVRMTTISIRSRPGRPAARSIAPKPSSRSQKRSPTLMSTPCSSPRRTTLTRESFARRSRPASTCSSRSRWPRTSTRPCPSPGWRKRASSRLRVVFLRSDRRFVHPARRSNSAPDDRPRGATSTSLRRKPRRYCSAHYGRGPPSTWRRSGQRAQWRRPHHERVRHLDAVGALIGREAETVVARTAVRPTIPRSRMSPA